MEGVRTYLSSPELGKECCMALMSQLPYWFAMVPYWFAMIDTRETATS